MSTNNRGQWFCRLGCLVSAAALVLVFSRSALAAEGGGESHAVIFNIALCMVAASGLGLLMKITRQPLILGHILAGVLIGPVALKLISDHSAIITISEIGLILLLFMIGLEIDLRKMLASGKLVILPGLLQFPICLGLGFAGFSLLERLGLDLGPGSFSRLYFAIAISISSTMIVVKLLYEKFELDTLAGRITLGILVFQDLWAIVILVIQPNLASPEVIGILKTFTTGALLVAASLALSRYVLPHLFKAVAKLPELMMVLSLGWCFLVCIVANHPRVGLSMEMGALIAGVSLATFPYNLDVIAKVVSIRDFFITLFFVALGMQIPLPEAGVILTALAIVGVALLVRLFGMFGVLEFMKTGHRVAWLTTLNLGQISEFSLVIMTLGVGYGHIQQESLTTAIWVFSIMAITSTYFIVYSDGIQKRLSRATARLGWKDIGADEEQTKPSADHPVVILGFFRVASAFLDEAARKHPHLLEKIKVIDFNPVVKQKLDAMGVACTYGDISHLDTLQHAEIKHAKVVLSTVPDPILKGTSNQKLLSLIKTVCPEAKVFLTAEMPSHALQLYEQGADYVIEISAAAGAAAMAAVDRALRGDLESLSAGEREELASRNEILA